jgi:hypothetical protein
VAPRLTPVSLPLSTYAIVSRAQQRFCCPTISACAGSTVDTLVEYFLPGFGRHAVNAHTPAELIPVFRAAVTDSASNQ